MNECPESRRKVDASKIGYSLDVLTDGSENTGHGTVFLTVQKRSISAQNADESFPSSVLARYALSGMSPLTGRLSSDQNFKLSPVRAVFLPTVKNVAVTAGIPSLLLSLSNYSMTGSLYIVGDENTDDMMDQLVDLILTRRAYPKVFSCVVPNEKCWWKVYDDEYITVHAQMIQTSYEMVTYLIALKQKNFSFAILPPEMDVHDGNWDCDIFHNLPLDETAGETILDLLLYLDPVKSSSIPVRLKNLAPYHLATFPNSGYEADSGLLVRATQNANALHTLLPSVFLFYSAQHDDQSHLSVGKIERKYNDNFVRIRSGYSVVLLAENDEIDEFGKKACTGLNIINRLEMIQERSQNTLHDKADFDANLDIAKFYSDPSAHRIQQLEDENEIYLDESEDDDSIIVQEPDSKRRKPNVGCTIFEDTEFPLLAILGTGCASPSPFRNSSGKAIFLPSVTTSGNIESRLTIVLECGEGFLTMLRRQVKTADGTTFGNLSDIRLIWISHSHLDHYGDLPLLLSSIRKSRGSTQVCICYDKPGVKRNRMYNQEEVILSKYDRCVRCGRMRLPILIAPSKVLKFVDILLGTKNGMSDNEKLFIGITHRDFEHSPFVSYVHEDIFGMEFMGHGNFPYRPIRGLRNIPVEHCPNSYGILLALAPINIKYPTFTVCYSGDTRPSEMLVQMCKENTRKVPKTSSRVRAVTTSDDERIISLLIHEATFDDDDKGQQEAIQKRHSTVKEALDISNRIETKSLVLTHFSQRYPKLPPSYISKEKVESKRNNDSEMKISIASAYDGMILPLRPDLQKVLLLIEGVLFHSFGLDDEEKK